MRKGLTQTLMAVAVVMLAAKVFAMAPVIGNIPNPVVGDAETNTPANTFVFPDAINLSQYVTDQETTDPTQIKWGYRIEGSTPYYKINGADMLTAGETVSDPPSWLAGAKVIAGPGATDADAAKVDANANTITIRNTTLSPVGGPNQAPAAGNNYVQAVTFYASDGTTTSLPKTVFFYTAKGNDGFSGGAVPTPVYNKDLPDATAKFGYFAQGGTVSSSTNATKGLCLTTAAAGSNMAKWTGPYGMLELVANSAYEIRATVNCDQNGDNSVPFWDLIINNFGYADPSVGASSGLKGQNLYGANYMFQDAVGGANAAYASRGDIDFVMWWVPSPVSTAQWNDTSSTGGNGGPFSVDGAPWKDSFIEFRVLDDAGNSAINGSAQGTLCLKKLVINRYSLADLEAKATNVYNKTSMVASEWTLSGFSGGVTGGVATIQATGGAVSQGIGKLEPGDTSLNYMDQASCADNYPVAMDSQALYEAKFTMKAPAAADAAAPPDVFWVGMDNLTNETICLSYVTLQAWHHAMPTTTPSVYKALFYSNYGTNHSNAAQFAWWSIIRPRFMVGNDPSLGGGGEANTGAIAITSVAVDKISLQ